jgi:hypothetical protein
MGNSITSVEHKSFVPPAGVIEDMESDTDPLVNLTFYEYLSVGGNSRYGYPTSER